MGSMYRVEDILDKYQVNLEDVKNQYNSTVIKKAFKEFLLYDKSFINLKPVEKAVMAIRYGYIL